MRPYAMNAKGDVVGTLALPNGAFTPFLYTGGVVYDLSKLSTQLTGGTPTGINDQGQIVMNITSFMASGPCDIMFPCIVYLLKPTSAPPPSHPPTIGGVSPASGSGSSQTMVFTFNDPDGWQDLDVVNIR